MAVRFDGDDLIATPSFTTAPNGRITVFGWCRRFGTTAGGTVLSQWGNTNGERNFVLGADGSFSLLDVGEGFHILSPTVAAPAGSWNALCGTYNSVTQIAYLNGRHNGQLSFTNALKNGVRDITSGGREEGDFLTGEVAHLAIWSDGLTPMEVWMLSKGMVLPDQVRRNALLAYWPLTDKEWRDYSGNSRHMAIGGATSPRHVDSILGFEAYTLPITVRESAYVDAAEIYLDLQASGEEVGPYTDAAEAYLTITPSGVEVSAYLDAAEAYVDLQPSGVDILERVDAAAIYVDLQASGTEYIQPLIPWWDPLPEAQNKWWAGEARKWREVTQTRFTWNVRGRL